MIVLDFVLDMAVRRFHLEKMRMNNRRNAAMIVVHFMKVKERRRQQGEERCPRPKTGRQPLHIA